jgi:HEAT repeat protein
MILMSAILATAQSPTIDKLIAGLKSSDIATRTKAADDLWLKSNKAPGALKKAVPALSEAVLDSDLNVRWMVITTLANIGPAAKPAVSSLIKAMDTFPGGTPPLSGPPRYYADVRSAAAHALSAIGADANNAIPALQKALKDPSSDVREAAAQALKDIRGK